MTDENNDDAVTADLEIMVDAIQPKAGDMLVVSVPDSMPHHLIMQNAERISAFIEKHVGMKLPIMVLVGNMDVSCFDASMMRQHGWVRPAGWVEPVQELKH